MTSATFCFDGICWVELCEDSDEGEASIGSLTLLLDGGGCFLGADRKVAARSLFVGFAEEAKGRKPSEESSSSSFSASASELNLPLSETLKRGLVSASFRPIAHLVSGPDGDDASLGGGDDLAPARCESSEVRPGVACLKGMPDWRDDDGLEVEKTRLCVTVLDDGVRDIPGLPALGVDGDSGASTGVKGLLLKVLIAGGAFTPGSHLARDLKRL